jgi:pimeloyl-ACP methyl ester carboxylesterase
MPIPHTAVLTQSTSLPFRERVWHKWFGRPYTLHYIDHGGGKKSKQNRPVIVLLHGLASSSANWDLLTPLLENTHHCISIDLLGFGESPKPQWSAYTIEDHMSSVHKTIRKLRLRRPFTIVGHSLGSLLATRYASLYPEQLERIVLLSPPVYPPLKSLESFPARVRTSMYLRAYAYLRNHPRVTPENIVRLTKFIPQLKFMVLNRPTWLPLVRSLENCIEQQTLVRDIRRVHMPIDVFFGKLDEVVVPYNVRQLSKIADVRLHPLNVNHAVGKRYSTAVAKVLAEPVAPAAEVVK